jgi:hypothetical protein
MKLLLLFLFFALCLGWRAANAGEFGRVLSRWPLLMASLVVGLAFLSLRVI